MFTKQEKKYQWRRDILNIKKYLNKKDPIDKEILFLSKKGEIKVGLVWIDK